MIDFLVERSLNSTKCGICHRFRPLTPLFVASALVVSNGAVDHKRNFLICQKMENVF